MCFRVFLFVAVSWMSMVLLARPTTSQPMTKTHTNTTIIAPTSYTSRGAWGPMSRCANGEHAIGFALKVDRYRGLEGDDTAVNGVKLECSNDEGDVRSAEGEWGTWRPRMMCPRRGWITGVAMRTARAPVDFGDYVGVTNFNFYCSNRQILFGNGWLRGEWSARTYCPAGLAICGVRTKVERPQGSFDDTALSKAEFLCCTPKKALVLAPTVVPAAVPTAGPVSKNSSTTVIVTRSEKNFGNSNWQWAGPLLGAVVAVIAATISAVAAWKYRCCRKRRVATTVCPTEVSEPPRRPLKVHYSLQQLVTSESEIE